MNDENVANLVTGVGDVNLGASALVHDWNFLAVGRGADDGPAGVSPSRSMMNDGQATDSNYIFNRKGGYGPPYILLIEFAYAAGTSKEKVGNAHPTVCCDLRLVFSLMTARATSAQS